MQKKSGLQTMGNGPNSMKQKCSTREISQGDTDRDPKNFDWSLSLLLVNGLLALLQALCIGHFCVAHIHNKPPAKNAYTLSAAFASTLVIWKLWEPFRLSTTLNANRETTAWADRIMNSLIIQGDKNRSWLLCNVSWIAWLLNTNKRVWARLDSIWRMQPTRQKKQWCMPSLVWSLAHPFLPNMNDEVVTVKLSKSCGWVVFASVPSYNDWWQLVCTKSQLDWRKAFHMKVKFVKFDSLGLQKLIQAFPNSQSLYFTVNLWEECNQILPFNC